MSPREYALRHQEDLVMKDILNDLNDTFRGKCLICSVSAYVIDGSRGADAGIG